MQMFMMLVIKMYQGGKLCILNFQEIDIKYNFILVYIAICIIQCSGFYSISEVELVNYLYVKDKEGFRESLIYNLTCQPMFFPKEVNSSTMVYVIKFRINLFCG